ncbi:zinc finger protein Paris [Drosophila kikkawai]|uniref:Zinc finger protein Paris n=1 Tax=Drosophila kikkawai TaxID=30033 RepID=A0A6P4I1C8_DROKI|nr:zinc finger protein 761 [Drosophila kikkawai]
MKAAAAPFSSEMFQTKLDLCARSMVADSTTAEQNASRTTLICRACLVLLGPQDAAYSLDSEQDLARKYFGCTGADPGKDEDDVLAQLVVLKSICECCYQLVQKFYAFQRMCEESSRNFQKLLQDIDLYCLKAQEDAVPALPDTPSESNESTNQEELAEAPSMESIEEIEEVYIIEDEGSKQDLGKEKVPRIFAQYKRTTGQRKRRVRHTLDCGICQRGFYKSSLLEAHVKQQHEGVNPYTCVHCGKSYARANLLDTHLREIHCNGSGRVTYPCPSCSKVYTAARSLKYHVKRQHESEFSSTDDCQYICEECGKSFGRRAHLTRHKATHGKPEERKYACEHCDHRFHTKENMTDHLQRRHGNRDLPRCRKCGRIFRERSDLGKHSCREPRTKPNVV